MQNSSSQGSLNWVDLYKVLRGAFIFLVAQLLTYASTVYTHINYSFTFHGTVFNFTAIAVVAIGSLIELGRRFVADYETKNPNIPFDPTEIQ